jgi:hypothetical protein
MSRHLLFTAPCLPLLASLAAANAPLHAQAPPQLIAVDTSGSETQHFGLPGTPLVAPVTQLRLRFDAALTVPLLSAFRVVQAGADGMLATVDCAALPSGDDIEVLLEALHWDALQYEATLQLAAPHGLPRGHYRVLACNAFAPAGGIASHDFAIEETPALSNPGFDHSMDGWTASSWGGTIEAMQDPLLDADGATHSGALRAAAPATGLLLEHAGCVELEPLLGWNGSSWRLRLRHRVLTGSVRVIAEFWTGFSGDLGEPDCRGPGISDHLAFDAQAAPGFATYESAWRPFEPMPLGQLSLRVSSLDGRPFEIVFDDIGLSFDSRTIFRDDFN